MLTGSIGLLAAVPLTTLPAAWLVGRVERSALPAEAVHSHWVEGWVSAPPF